MNLSVHRWLIDTACRGLIRLQAGDVEHDTNF